MPFDGEIERDAILRRIEAHPLGETPAQMRAAFHGLIVGGCERGPDDVEVAEDAAGIVARPCDTTPGPPILWFHGGGYVFGSPRTHLRAAARVAAVSGREVVLPRYRLAPEHRWPAQLNDALEAIAAREEAPILAGDSAGGHLALVSALAMARRGTPPPGLLLFSPNTDRSGRNAARRVMDFVDPVVDDAGDRALARLCFGEAFDASDPEVSPLLDDLSLLPPTHIEVGQPEVLLDDSTLLHEEAIRQGAEMTLQVTPGLLHMGQLWAPAWFEANASLDRAAAVAARIG